MAAFISFESNCFPEHLKVAAAFFIKQAGYFFFSKHFYLKNHPKKHVPSFSLPWWKKIPSLLFMFSWLLFTLTLFKNLSLPVKLKDFDFFNPTLGEGVVFTSPIYLGKYLTNSAQNWPEGRPWLRNLFFTLKNLKKVWRHGLFCCHLQKIAIFPIFIVYQ